MDGYKSKKTHHLSTKRKRESSPLRREFDYRETISGSYREGPSASTPSGFGPTGNNKKLDRYVSRDVASSHTGIRQHDQFKSEKPIPTGPRSQRERKYRPPYQSVGIDSRPLPSAGPEGIQQKQKINYGNNSSIRNQKAFNSARCLEPQEEYMKKSIARSKQGYRDQKSTRKEKVGENHQIDFAKRDAFSPIESISTADDERNGGFTPKQFAPSGVRRSSYPEARDVLRPTDNIISAATSTVTSSEPVTNSGNIIRKEHNAVNLPHERSPAVFIDHTCLPAPIPQVIHSQLPENSAETQQVPILHLHSTPTPTSSINLATAPENHTVGFQPLFTRKDSPMSTSAMSISSGSSPVHSPASNSPSTNTNFHKLSPSPCSTSSSSREKAKCILCKGLALKPLKALVRCIECRHNYHTYCHTPRITMTKDILDVDVNLWVCSRCTKTRRASPTGSHNVKRAGAGTIPHHSSGIITPIHKRRKLDLESTPVSSGEVVPGSGNQETQGSLPAGASRSSNDGPDVGYGQIINERPRPDQLYEDMRPRDWLMSESQIDSPQGSLQHSSPYTECLQAGVNIVSAPTFPDSQANPSPIERPIHLAHLPRESIRRVSLETRNAAKSNDDLDDGGDVPMELESPRSPQHYSPEVEQEQVRRADNNINHESTAIPLVSVQSPITTESANQSGAKDANPVGNKGTEEDINSPPYSPQLDDDLPGSPIADTFLSTPATNIELPTTTQTTSATPKLLLQQKPLNLDLQAPPIVSLPLPLVIPSVGSAVSPVASLQTLLGPTTTFPCANCGVPWPMFVNVARPDGRNYCVHCLYNQQRSPRTDTSTPLAREPVKERKPPRPPKGHRSQSLSIPNTRHFEKDCSSSSFTKNVRTAETRKTSPRPPVNFQKPESTAQPVEKIITAQQLMEEKYKKHPEIFPTNSRFLSNREIEKSSEERPVAVTQIKDKSEGKDGPKKKLTVSEYALRKKEKEKGLPRKEPNTSLPQGNVGQQEAVDICNPDTTEAVVAAMDDTGKLALELVKAVSPNALTNPAPVTSETETVVPGDTEAYRQLKEKLFQEIEQWKRKFEEQKGFISNYVKHNAKIMGKLSYAEQQKLLLEKKATILEAEITSHRKKEEQLKEENEQLRQQRIQQDVELQSRVEFDAAEARAKAMYEGSQSHAEKKAPEEEDQGFLMKNVYKNLTFDVLDPLRDIAVELYNVPPKPATKPMARYSATRKAEVLNFNYTNLRSLHLHREVDRTSNSNIRGRASSSSGSPFSCAGTTHSDKSRRSMTSGESSDGKTVTFEEFARIPPNMVPVLKEGVLAFRAGQLNPRTRRLDRSVNCYKVGRDVPGELRGIR